MSTFFYLLLISAVAVHVKGDFSWGDFFGSLKGGLTGGKDDPSSGSEPLKNVEDCDENAQVRPQDGYYAGRPQDIYYADRPQDGGYPVGPQDGGYPVGPQDGGYPGIQQDGGYPDGPPDGGYPGRPQGDDGPPRRGSSDDHPLIEKLIGPPRRGSWDDHPLIEKLIGPIKDLTSRKDGQKPDSTAAPSTTTEQETTTTEVPTTTEKEDLCKEDVEIMDSCSCGESSADMDDYTHDTTRDRARHPWLMRICRADDDKKCGTCSGTLIKQNFVLTTAGCVYGYEKEDIIVRNSKGCEIGVSKICIYPYYRQNPKYHNDIAVLKLKKPFDCTKYTMAICLPRAQYHFGQPNTKMVTAKIVKDNLIKEGDCTIMKNGDACGDESDASRFCTDDKDRIICHGGIGSPGIQQNKEDKSFRIVGLANAELNETCSRNKDKTPYTKVEDYSKFIQQCLR